MIWNKQLPLAMSNSGVTSEADETRSTAYITGIYMNQTSNCEQGKANDADPADQESGDKAADLFEYNVVKAPPKVAHLRIKYEDFSSQSVSHHVQRCAPIWTQMSTFFVCNKRIAQACCFGSVVCKWTRTCSRTL